MSRLTWAQRRPAIVLATLPLAGTLACGTGTPQAPDAVVRTTGGLVRGAASGAVLRYYGVPYAAPPTGARRWRPPAPVAPWAGVRPALRPGRPCPQGTGAGDAEDCLHLDVTVPRTRPARGGRPVLVWLHGDGFQGGTGSEIDPARMAVRGGVAVVSVDFRLGIFGLFGLPGLPGSGTFTLQDQQAALRWVRANIGAFGGDPRNVTLFGQSGGAVGACAQLTSPPAAGLFDKVILQSGSCAVRWPAGGMGTGTPAGSFFRPVADVARSGGAAARALGCAPADLACLRRVPMTKVLAHNGEFTAAATGTPTLPEEPAAAIHAGRFHPVPAISGHTRDELTFLAALMRVQGLPLGRRRYLARLAEGFGTGGARRVAALYPPPAKGDAWVPLYRAYGDRMFVCSQIETGDALARRVPVYSYEFADEKAPPYSPTPTDFPAGATHAAELLYLFDIKGKPVDFAGRPLTYTPAQRALATTMIDYWTSFARTGRPGGGWRRGGGSSELVLAPGAATATVDGAAEHRCGFWRTVADRR
ncbi:Para-nitrobenzyl esterase [Actinomadura rubteroloni]|uniref:Carboxylic ester hydrolase n=1 Tax=Actinomadura rubteroloni TaxID=1926885 RepID=A0A2P4URV7_9ACTN|nr:carboxylesterase family protein [Actinomadura rubteroloni]POM27781.1 Para-nitrobenzyl esterase [Actinomadura rubteroloni]